MERERIIVSLTTYRKRISNIPVVLDTIFAQTLPPDFVVLNLATDEVVPEKVQIYIDSHPIEINRGPDTKVFKKLIPTLKKYPDDCIISIDDDFLYPKEMIADFIHIHNLYPNNPISGNEVVLERMQCHCGCASLTKYAFFEGQLCLIDEDLVSHCKCDDIVYTYFANRSGHPYVRTKGLYFNNMPSYNEGESYSVIVGEGTGIKDTYNYLVNRFGQLKRDTFTTYFQGADPYIISLIEDIYEKSISSKVYLQAYQQGVSEMKSSCPFRIGSLILMPFMFLRNIYDSFMNKNKC